MNLKTELTFNVVFSLLLAVSFFSQAMAQEGMPPPGPEYDLLKKDVGKWDCVIKTWEQPGAKPSATKGSETGYMFDGGYWLMTSFEGKMMGLDFKGHGTYGYDAKKKKYVGTWIDSLGPYMMHVEGEYDKETETLNMVGDSPGPDGETMFTYTMSTCYKDNNRVMTMYMQPKGSGEDQKMKFFEITYSKSGTGIPR